VGGFDEDFFAYTEDIDLDMRLQLAGYPFVYLPQAVVAHVGSGSTSYRSELSVYYGHRNLIWVFVKNMPGFLFYLLLPAHIFFNLLYLIAGFFIPSGKALLRGKRDALKGLPGMLKKRHFIQSRREITLFQFAKLLDWNPLSPLVKIQPSKEPYSRFFYINPVGELSIVSSIHDALNATQDGGYMWLDYCDPKTEDLEPLITELNIHPLSIEDSLNEEQLPKLGQRT